jgi:hypothetical protein
MNKNTFNRIQVNSALQWHAYSTGSRLVMFIVAGCWSQYRVVMTEVLENRLADQTRGTVAVHVRTPDRVDSRVGNKWKRKKTDAECGACCCAGDSSKSLKCLHSRFEFLLYLSLSLSLEIKQISIYNPSPSCIKHLRDFENKIKT